MKIGMEHDGLDLIESQVFIHEDTWPADLSVGHCSFRKELFLEYPSLATQKLVAFIELTKGIKNSEPNEKNEDAPNFTVLVDRRVRIDYAGEEAANTELRFSLRDNPYVSVPEHSRPKFVSLPKKGRF